jgi:hypothetical protein
VPAAPHTRASHLRLLESVRCLECGSIYAKPCGGGTVHENPGCPDCSYVGWVVADTVSAGEEWPTPRRRGGDPLLLLFG